MAYMVYTDAVLIKKKNRKFNTAKIKDISQLKISDLIIIKKEYDKSICIQQRERRVVIKGNCITVLKMDTLFSQFSVRQMTLCYTQKWEYLEVSRDLNNH